MKKLAVFLYEVKGGVSVCLPSLTGCRAEGASEQEALGNLQSAIQEYAAAIVEYSSSLEVVRKIPEAALDGVPTVDVSDAVKGFEAMGFRNHCK